MGALLIIKGMLFLAGTEFIHGHQPLWLIKHSDNRLNNSGGSCSLDAVLTFLNRAWHQLVRRREAPRAGSCDPHQPAPHLRQRWFNDAVDTANRRGNRSQYGVCHHEKCSVILKRSYW
jgi:hypothetical protein